MSELENWVVLIDKWGRPFVDHLSCKARPYLTKCKALTYFHPGYEIDRSCFCFHCSEDLPGPIVDAFKLVR